jgi:uncharacterized membrane protein
MVGPDREEQGEQLRRRRYERESLEFGRVVNLSDALFGIAMTLLVFSVVDATDVDLDRVAGALVDQGPQLLAFVLSFAVVANFWWIHHRFFGLLGALEPGLIAINLVLLGAVALVPYPTYLIGQDLTARGAVVPYLAVLSVVALLHLLLLVRAGAVGAWRQPMPDGLYPWLLVGWGSSTVVALLGLVVAFVVPPVGLAMLLLTWPAELLVARRAPAAYAEWG